MNAVNPPLRYQITRGGKVVAHKDGFETAEEAHEARQAKLAELDAASPA